MLRVTEPHVAGREFDKFLHRLRRYSLRRLQTKQLRPLMRQKEQEGPVKMSQSCFRVW